MTACRALLPCLLLLLAEGAGCKGGRPPPSTVTRSDRSGPVLPSDPAALASALGVPPESLIAAGQERYGRQAYDSARAIWTVGLAQARAEYDSTTQARTMMWLGLAAWRLGDYGAARDYGEQSLKWKRRLSLDGELSRSYNALGLLAWNEGRHRDALLQFDSAAATAQRHGDIAGVARALANIPLVQVELGQYEAARRGLRAAHEAGRLANDDRTQANALANLGMLEIRLGNSAGAIPLLQRARRQYVAIEYATGEANALGQLATALGAQGDLQRALAAADSGLGIARAQGLQQEVASILEVIADLHLKAGSPRLALLRLREADSVDALMGLVVEQGNNLRRAATVLLHLGEGEVAATRAREALALHQQVEAIGEEIQDRLQLALALQQSGRARHAKAEVDTAIVQAARIHHPAALMDAAEIAAELALRSGDLHGALRYAGRVPISPGQNDWELDNLRAGALLALGRLDEARRAAERAVATLERERSTLGVGPLRSAYFISRVAPFSRLVSVHLARQDTAAAFAAAAALPGRGLAERLGALAGASAGPLKNVAEGERLLLHAAALERELTGVSGTAADIERRKAMEQEIGSARAAYEEHLAHAAPSPAERLLGLNPVKLESVQAHLSADQALLLTLSAPEGLDVFLVRQRRLLHHHSSVSTRDLGTKVRVARELIGREGSVDVPAVLGELHQILLGSFYEQRGLQGVSQLLIVPHGPLAALPFAMLWNRGTGRFLVEDVTIGYLPAVAALDAEKEETAGAGERLAIFAPLPDSLPGTAQEARSLQRLQPGATLKLGPAATERGVRNALRDGRSVHLATHGSHNGQNPLFSRLIVGHPTRSDPADDGRLELHEVLTLSARSPLVFLSGCETGLATAGQEPFTRGMEEGSLAQAFLIAGVRTVVATLWRVPDEGAGRMAERFYRHMLTGGSAAESLAQAQREALRNDEGLSWGAYSVFGSGRRKPGMVVRATGERP